MPTLNVFTCANARYEDFGSLFAASVLWSNPDVSVELGVENEAAFMAGPHGAAIRSIRERYPNNEIVIRNADFIDASGALLRPISVRFLTTPVIKSEFVYISDIDIITFNQNILERHLKHMQVTGLPFSNRLLMPAPGSRYKEPKLSGLHFTRYDAYYPLPEFRDLPYLRMNDEVLLYKLVERKIGAFTAPPDHPRPVHGIHVSPNRSPYFWMKGGSGGRVRPGWLMEGMKYIDRWKDFRSSDLFRSLEPFLSERMTRIVWELDNFDEKKSRQMLPSAIVESPAAREAIPGEATPATLRSPVGPSGLTNL